MNDANHSLDPVQLEHRLTMLEALRDADRAMVTADSNYIRQLNDQSREYVQKALDVQAKEYERRLEDLNGERAREREHMADFLPRETFEAFVENSHSYRSEVARWRESVNAALAVMAGKTQGVQLAWAVGVALVGIGLGVLGFLL